MKNKFKHKKSIKVHQKKFLNLIKKLIFVFSIKNRNKKIHSKYVGFKSLNSKAQRLSNPYTVYKTKRTLYQRIKDKYFKLLVLLIFGFQVFLILYSPYFTINKLEIQGLERISYENINKIIEQYLKKKNFGVLPNNNIFLLNSDKLVKTLSQNYSIESLTLEKMYLDRIVNVTIKERMPVTIMVHNSEYYSIDSLGFVISKEDSDIATYSRLPVIYTSEKFYSDTPKIGDQLLDENLVDSINKIDHAFSVKTEVKIVSYKITNSDEIVLERQETEEKALTAKAAQPKEESNEEDKNIDEEDIEIEKKEVNVNVKLIDGENFSYPELTLITNEGIEIYFGNEPFKSENKVDKQLSNIILLLEKQGQIQSQKTSYIDLRFINKIFYK